MEIIKILNYVIAFAFFLCYSYQVILYIPLALFKKSRAHGEEREHKYAVMICARNEEKVIGGLIDSIHSQSYNPKNITIFVLADNCTDNTAQIAKAGGAVVYERFNKELIGKGYALGELVRHIQFEYGETFDGYLLLDADNVLDRNYIKEMNKTFSDGHDIVTGYLNSKNFGDNWISAGYSIGFMHQSRYLNYARSLLGTSCAAPGTGLLFSSRIMREIGGWKFHLLTEDMEFSVYHILKGEKIVFCRDAILYDEQPVKFRQSWRQRIRWTRGYLQVFGRYGGRLIAGVFKGSFSCFDIAMANMVTIVLSSIAMIANILSAVISILDGTDISAALGALGLGLLGTYFMMYLMGLITTVSEWKRIHTTNAKKILYTFTFPLFMFTYIPISFAAVFTKVTWKPIEHTVTASYKDIQTLKK